MIYAIKNKTPAQMKVQKITYKIYGSDITIALTLYPLKNKKISVILVSISKEGLYPLCLMIPCWRLNVHNVELSLLIIIFTPVDS